MILGSWASEGSHEVSMEINPKNVVYLNDEGGAVPYQIVGDSLFFKSEDLQDHYLLTFKEKDTMTMTDTIGITTFHRVKE